ncbi:MAG TPA: ATP-binding protein, partial [Vicinamibacterales bacterium]
MTPAASAARAGDIASALAALDARLAIALDAFDEAQGGPTADRLRGLYVSAEQARDLLRDGVSPLPVAGRHLLWSAESNAIAARLASQFDLTSFELDALLIAIAPECDLRYERLYAYLQDDVTRKRPTVDLILNLLCSSPEDRLARREVFCAERTLVAEDIVTLVADVHHPHAPLLAQYVVPDSQVVHAVFGGGLDLALVPCCRLDDPQVHRPTLALDPGPKRALAAASRAFADGPAHFWISGPDGCGKSSFARAIAAGARRSLLTCDAARVPADSVATIARRAAREAQGRSAILFVRHAEAWVEPGAAAAALDDLVGRAGLPLVVGATASLPAALSGHAQPVALGPPSTSVRARCWHGSLERRGAHLAPAATRLLADRFALTPGQIDTAAAAAQQRGEVTVATLSAAAREQTRQGLAALASRIEPRATWNDIVLSENVRAQLRELCDRVAHRDRVLTEWGFADTSARGRGVATLFAGPSGTGKTMAAEVVAWALGLDLFRIDLARVVSKYIGDTERNLAKVFAAARSSNAILFFDEADALFGKRSDVRDAHDRYANIEISYLLQQMEDYDGLAILATNLPENLDDAFT